MLNIQKIDDLRVIVHKFVVLLARAGQADVYPLRTCPAAVLPNQLPDLYLARLDEPLDAGVQFAVVLGVRGLDVGRLTQQVLAALDAANRRIEPRAAVAAGHDDGLSPCFTDRLQHLNRKTFQASLRLSIGRVVDAVIISRYRKRQFLQ